MTAPVQDVCWRDLLGTNSPLVNRLARLAYGARSVGFVATVAEASQRLRHRAGNPPGGPTTAPTANVGQSCTWLDDLPQFEQHQRLIRASEIAAFMQRAAYPRYYYRGEKRLRYALWHFVGLELAGRLCVNDVVLDAGAQNGIWGQIARRLHRCTVYDADLQYRSGVHGRRIGCEVGAIPLPDESLTVIVSFCAFNCFEAEADQAFLRESSRLLAPGGRLVIVPLCIADEYVNLYDPGVVQHIDRLDECAQHIAWHGWGNNFGRWYDRQAFETRFLRNLSGMAISITRVNLEPPAVGGIQDFYAAVCTKSG